MKVAFLLPMHTVHTAAADVLNLVLVHHVDTAVVRRRTNLVDLRKLALSTKFSAPVIRERSAAGTAERP